MEELRRVVGVGEVERMVRIGGADSTVGGIRFCEGEVGVYGRIGV